MLGIANKKRWRLCTSQGKNNQSTELWDDNTTCFWEVGMLSTFLSALLKAMSYSKTFANVACSYYVPNL